MNTTASAYRVGNATITKLAEITLDEVPATYLYPQADPAEAAKCGRALNEGSYSPDQDVFRISVHAWLVQTPDHVVLIDAASGNDKLRTELPAFNQLHQPFLERLAEAGVSPDDVDAVLLTHLHVDHVGWNTRLVNDRWLPTFRKATHVYSAREKAYVASVAANDGNDDAIRAEAALGQMVAKPSVEFWKDSMLPVIEAGLAREITVDGSEVLDGFAYVSTPGHSIDHASIAFTSQGEQAFFWGDMMHNPVQFAHPEWNSVFCEFPEAASRSRLRALEHAANNNALVLTTHFAESSAGRVTREGDRFAWRFV